MKYNLIAKNIITTDMDIDEFFHVSNRGIAKEMWDTLKMTNEGTTTILNLG